MAETATEVKKPVFKRLAEVTVAQLKIKPNEEQYVKFAGPIHLGQQLADKISVDPKTGEVSTETPKRAHVAYVTDLQTMKPSMIVVSSVMVSEIERGYPDQSYVGLCFGFKSLGKVGGKTYNSVEIWQVEEPEGVPEMRIAPGVLNGTIQAAPPPEEAPKAQTSTGTATQQLAAAQNAIEANADAAKAKPKK